MSAHPPAAPPSSRQQPSTRATPAQPSPRSTSLLLAVLAGTILALAAAVTTLLRLHRQRAALHTQLHHARREARHDPLTGLPNRHAVLDALTAGAAGMVGLLDLNDFKSVNDRHGHHIGDQLLIAVAERLRASIQAHGSAARLSGDEFVVLWHHQPAAPLDQADALLERLSAPITIEGHHLRPAASLGLALAGPHLSGPALLAAADHAMYEGKYLRRRTTTAGDPPASITRLYRDLYPPAPVDRRTSPRRRPPRRNPAGPSRSSLSVLPTASPDVDCP